MGYLAQIQRGVDFIEANLDDSFSLNKVAREAGMSQWHFQRMFKALTGDTLKGYIRKRRLGRSLDELLNTRMRIIDIALNAGFESQESFTRAFKKAFDVTPLGCRSRRQKIFSFPQVKFDESYLKHINRGVSMQPEIYEQRKMTLVGLHTTFFGTFSDKNNVAKKLPSLWQSFLPRLVEIKNQTGILCYGVVRPISDKSEELEYFCAIEVTSTKDIPKGMVAVEIPANTYAKFIHKGGVDKIDTTINYIYATWLPQSGKRHTYSADLEFYGSDYDPFSEASVMHYAIPVQ